MAMVHSSSRYAGMRILRTPHRSGRLVESLPFRIFRPPLSTQNEKTYQPSPGEYVDQIAHKIYGTPYLWHSIADRNPELAWPLNVSADSVLVIPSHDPGR